MSPFAFTSSSFFFLQNSTHKERAKGGSKRRKSSREPHGRSIIYMAVAVEAFVVALLATCTLY